MIRRAALVLLVLASAAGTAAWFLYRQADVPWRGYSGDEQFVEIVHGDGPRAIGRTLEAAGVVRGQWAFRIALWRTGSARRLKAGEYRFDRPLTAMEVVEKLARGDVYLRTITFPEGLTIGEMSRLFEAHGLGRASEFVAAAKDPSPVAHLDPRARDLEGYLFPETYRLSRRAGAEDLVRQMVARFEQVFPEPLREAARSRGLDLRQAVTLASLVEKETALAGERPAVAGVYLRRLASRMPLQCDPTVIYALQQAGRYNGNLTRTSLAFDSRYNTYRYPGLPPGPIASPSRGSLEAAANPSDQGFLYFVSRNDGSHEFARTLAEHNRNVARYQKAPRARTEPRD